MTNEQESGALRDIYDEVIAEQEERDTYDEYHDEYDSYGQERIEDMMMRAEKLC